MANSFLDAALDLLGRPGNTVRGGLIAGPEGALQGLTGQRRFDGTELPGVSQLPDEGIDLGPLHLTPRTVAGFGASTLLDPLTYAGAGIGRLGALGRGAEDLGLFTRELETPELSGVFQGGVTHPHFQDSLEPGGSRLSLTKDSSLEDLDPLTGAPLHGQIPPSADATPVGDSKYAQARNKLETNKADLRTLQNTGGNAEDWLDYTSTADTGTKPGSQWEDVIGVKRGSDPTDPSVASKQEASDVDYAAGKRDLSQGPGLTSQYPVNGQPETVGFSRQEVLNHVSHLQDQIDRLTQQITGNKGSRFGDPLEQRGMENTLSDWQAKRQLAADPSLAQPERNQTMLDYQTWAKQNGYSPKSTLSDKQETTVQRKAGQRLSREDSARHAPDARFYTKGSPEAAPDEANMNMYDGRDTRAPHADPLEEERALKAQEDKFGRKGAGTYQNEDMLGFDDNTRPGGVRRVPAGGEMDAYQNAQPDHVLTRLERLRSDEPAAAQPDVGAPTGKTADLSPSVESELATMMQAIRLQVEQQMLRTAHPNRFLGY